MNRDYKRGRMEIINDILELIMSGNIKKTHIMYRANLSFSQTQDYLSLLLEKELIERRNNRYYVRQKGIKLLSLFMDIKGLEI